ncbi:glycosyltransferase [Desulforamulus aeronauticus]|uniref:Glycosyl transferase family 2 n=1 Tax=Desulforamulus aeronauticus DSM 10349 TaxID=1121421 RepID=A0A1M6TPY4_9FIRM|nr:glycosyltransferase [Desulforamulus aeronauticus]SHK59004.1 Glycosyl transferase family 2 [Desulforamulus aeronauticus DSM 10349]
MKTRVLLASPIKQKKNILKEFLSSLEKLHQSGLVLDYVFIDDNNDHNLLERFSNNKKNVRIIRKNTLNSYTCDEKTHQWREELIWKVAAFKNSFIAMALQEDYDYLFLVDSDLYLHPKTIKHLISLQKDIVSEVFWTRWEPDLPPLPQVWVADQYQLYDAPRCQKLREEEINQRATEFIAMLSKPGTYKVGGLGACTLVSKQALLRGVSFSEIYNLGFWGEDRHFCIRAAALGFELFADTHYPPFHIYRESELPQLKEYKKNMNLGHSKDGKKTDRPGSKKGKGNKITLAMLVRNESDRYLEKVLQQAKQFVDNVVILDDASEDNTVEVCKKALEGIPLTIVANSNPSFTNEIILRKQLWQMAVTTSPDWILILDADEIFEENAPEVLKKLAQSKDVSYYSFRLYDMWSETHYREDQYWCAHQQFRPFMVRYLPDFHYLWQETPLHCGRFPVNIAELKGENHPLRIKHLGWLKPADRLKKYYRYKELDPQRIYGIAQQYDSILDPRPNLLPWLENSNK